MSSHSLKKIPFNQPVVVERIARVQDAGGHLEKLQLNHNETNFLQSPQMFNLGLTNAANTNQQKVYSALSHKNIYSIRMINGQQRFEMIPLPFRNDGKQVPCARVYLTNQKGDLAVTATNLEGQTDSMGHKPVEMAYLNDDYDTPMAQWWLIPAETAFPQHPNVTGAYVIRSFAGNGMFLASDDDSNPQPVLRKANNEAAGGFGAANSGVIDLWRVSRCALGHQGADSARGRNTYGTTTTHINNNPSPVQNYDYAATGSPAASTPQYHQAVQNQYHQESPGTSTDDDGVFKVITGSSAVGGSYEQNPAFQTNMVSHDQQTRNMPMYNEPKTTETFRQTLDQLLGPGPKEPPTSNIISARTTGGWKPNTSNTNNTGPGFHLPFPGNTTRTTVETSELRQQALVSPPFWGLSMDAGDTEIDYVWVDGPAHKAGIMPYDTITKIDGEPVSSYAEVVAGMRASKINEPVNVTCVRDGQEQEHTIYPMTANKAFQEETDLYYDKKTHIRIPTPEDTEAHADMKEQQTFVAGGDAGSSQLRQQALDAPPFWGVSMDNGDTEIDYVWVDGPAYEAGIRPLDNITHVNGARTETYEDVVAGMRASKVNEPCTVTCERGGRVSQHTLTPKTANPGYSSFDDIYYDKPTHHKIPEKKASGNSIRQKALVAPPFWGVAMDAGDTEIDYVWVDGPAHKAGIMPYDTITKVNGKPAATYGETIAGMKASKINEPVTITFTRDGKEMERTLTPQTANKEFKSETDLYYNKKTHTRIPTAEEVEKRAEMKEQQTFVAAGDAGSSELRQQALNAPPFWGVAMDSGDTEIDYVWVDGPAYEAGIRPLDDITHVNGKRAETYEDVVAGMRASKVNEPCKVTCKRDGKSTEHTLTPQTANPGYSSLEDIYYHKPANYRIPESKADQQRRLATTANGEKKEADAAVEAQRKAEAEAAAAAAAAKASGDAAAMAEAKRLEEEAKAAAETAQRETRQAEEAAAAATAVPAQKTEAELKEEARAKAPPFWGVTIDEKTAKVKELWMDGPAYKAGIRPKDQIVRVSGVDVSNYDEALAQMKKTKVGEENTITVLKPSGEKIQSKMTPLTNKPAYKDVNDIYYHTQEGTTNYKIPLEGERKAAAIAEAAAKAPPFWGVTLNEKNAKVMSLWEDGPTWKAGIRPDDQIVRVAGVDVSNYDATLAQMKKTKVNEENTITVLKPDGKKIQSKMTPLTNRPAYQDVEEIFFDTSKTGPNKKFPE